MHYKLNIEGHRPTKGTTNRTLELVRHFFVVVWGVALLCCFT